MQVAKTCSVNDRIKLFDTQNVYEGDASVDERTREQKAEAIRREILELKSQNNDEKSMGSDVEIQSPIESKVKPLKIPMKPKMVDGGKQPRGVPGATLRINQPPGIQTSPQPSEVKSILRSSRSTERNPMSVISNNNTDDTSQQRRGSLEHIGSVKSRIESYLSATEEELQQQQQQQQQSNNNLSVQPSSSMSQQLKSILVNSEKAKKRSPKLVDSGNCFQIYTQSATDYSEDDEELALRNRQMESHLLQIPEHPGFLKNIIGISAVTLVSTYINVFVQQSLSHLKHREFFFKLFLTKSNLSIFQLC
jgi:hypothetical protein